MLVQDSGHCLGLLLEGFSGLRFIGFAGLFCDFYEVFVGHVKHYKQFSLFHAIGRIIIVTLATTNVEVKRSWSENGKLIILYQLSLIFLEICNLISFVRLHHHEDLTLLKKRKSYMLFCYS